MPKNIVDHSGFENQPNAHNTLLYQWNRGYPNSDEKLDGRWFISNFHNVSIKT